MSTKKEIRPHTFGLALLMTVFLILCLLTFAAISITEARNDLTGAEKKLQNTIAYNEAENMAELTLADFTAEASLDPEQAEPELDFSVGIDDSDELHVCAELYRNEETGSAGYRINRWQVVSNAPWDADQTVEVLPDGQIGW